MKVLNKELYAKLRDVFGDVSVINPGVPADISFDYQPSIGESTHVRWWVPDGGQKGEQYAVRCPYCGDHGKHLYISHTSYMVPSVPMGQAVPGKLIANCFHGCLKDHPERLAEIDRKLTISGGAFVTYKEIQEDSQSPEYSTAATVKGIQSWCPGYEDFSTAPQQVLDYVQERGYTPEYLKRWMVGWSVIQSTASGRMLNNGEPFLVIPIIQNRQLRGYQARACRSKEDCEKRGLMRWYIHPGCRKSSVIFNIDSASKYPICVLTEGVFGVFRIGPCGVATFGPAPSAYQEKLLASRWSKGALIWIPDTLVSKGLNPIEKAKGIVERYNRDRVFAHGAHIVTIPAKDPDEMSSDDLWAEITKQTGNLLTSKIWGS